jgi:hypothetical protein
MGGAPSASAPGLPSQGVPEEPSIEVAAHRAQPIHAFANPGLLGADSRWSPECPRTLRGSRCIGSLQRSTTRGAKRGIPSIDPTRVALKCRPRAPNRAATHRHTHTHTHTRTHTRFCTMRYYEKASKSTGQSCKYKPRGLNARVHAGSTDVCCCSRLAGLSPPNNGNEHSHFDLYKQLRFRGQQCHWQHGQALSWNGILKWHLAQPFSPGF